MPPPRDLAANPPPPPLAGRGELRAPRWSGAPCADARRLSAAVLLVLAAASARAADGLSRAADGPARTAAVRAAPIRAGEDGSGDARLGRTAAERAARAVVLEAPFPMGRASFFYAALEVPPLDTARPLPLGILTLRLSTSHTRSLTSRSAHGIQQRFNGLYHEWAGLEVRAGVLPRVELSARAALTGWDEKLDVFSIFDRGGAPIVRDEARVIFGTSASSRHENVTRVVLGGKALLLARERARFDLALAMSVKIPFGRARDLTNAGTTDLNVAALASVPLGPVTLHANLGGGLPLGAQNIFTRAAGVDLKPFLHGGLGLTARLSDDLAAVWQLEGNTSAFSDVDLLDGSPLTIFAGLRALLGDIFLEGGAGAGLVPRSSYDWALGVSVGLVL